MENSDLIRVLFIIECSRSPENERRKTKDEKRKVRTAKRQKGKNGTAFR
jgi:hypothetical protein